MPDVVPAFLWREERECGGDEGDHVVKRARTCGAQQRFQFGERLLDRIEVRTVRWQEAQLCARTFNGEAHVWVAMHREVVEDDDIAPTQRRHQDLVDVGEKRELIDRAVEDRRGRQAGGPQRGDNRVRFPMPTRRVIAQARAPRAAAVASQQVRGDATFIDEDIPPRIPPRLPLTPSSSCGRDVGTSLFVGVYRFF